jgi:hypothetical protein
VYWEGVERYGRISLRRFLDTQVSKLKPIKCQSSLFNISIFSTVARVVIFQHAQNLFKGPAVYALNMLCEIFFVQIVKSPQHGADHLDESDAEA